MKKTKRIGSAMQRAIAYVAAHPGCLLIDAARAAHPHPRNFAKCCALGYNPVHRAVKAGVLVKTAGGRRGTFALAVKVA